MSRWGHWKNPVIYMSRATTREVWHLLYELTRRNMLPRCPCGRWQTYVGVYDQDGHTLRCHGCLRAIARCTCG